MAQSAEVPKGDEAATTAVEKSRRKFNIRTYFPILLFVVLCAIFSIGSDRFFSFGNAMIILQQAVVPLVAALGMTFVVVGGSIDLSVGSIVALSALAAAATSTELGIAALIPAVVVGTLCGAHQRPPLRQGKGSLLYRHAGHDDGLSGDRPLLDERCARGDHATISSLRSSPAAPWVCLTQPSSPSSSRPSAM